MVSRWGRFAEGNSFLLKGILAALVLLPMLELAVFIAVAWSIGLLAALGLQLATTFAGMLLLLRHGPGLSGLAADRGRGAGVRLSAAIGGLTGLGAESRGAALIFAGMLLALPGFLTDLAGIAVLVGPLRRLCTRALYHWAGLGASRPPGDPAVVDLDPDEWRQMPNGELPGRAGPSQPATPTRPVRPSQPAQPD